MKTISCKLIIVFLFLLSSALASAGMIDDFEGEALLWTAQATAGTVVITQTDEMSFSGNKSLKMEYEGLGSGDYLSLMPTSGTLEGLPLELNLRASGAVEKVQLLLTDAKGRVFTFPLGRAYPNQWISLKVDWQAVLGEGDVQLPVILTQLRFFSNNSSGTLFLDQLQSKELILNPIQGTYLAEKPLELICQVQYESTAVPNVPLSVQLRRGSQLVEERQITFSAATTVGKLYFGSLAPDLYECELTGQIGKKNFIFPTAGVVLLPPVPPSVTKPFLGVQTHYGLWRGKLPDNLDLANISGTELIRDELFWGQIEKERGVYSFDAEYTSYVDAALERGLKPLIILDYGNNIYGGGMPTTADQLAAWRGYVKAVVGRYKGKIKYWEVWNEPNIGAGMTDAQKREYATRSAKAKVYFPLLRETYSTIKQIDPRATVIGGVTAEVDLEFIGALIAEGGLEYMDALSIHPYCYPKSPEEANLPGKLQQVRGLVGDRQLPIWITEIGWPTHRGARGVDEQTQADYLARMYTMFAAEPDVEAVFWYDFQNDGTDPTYNEHNFGLIRQDFSPKPAYFSLSQIFRALRGFTKVEPIQTGEEGLWHYRVVNLQGEKQILWSTTGSREQQVPFLGTCQLTNLDGSRTLLKSTELLPVMASPIIVEAYIEGESGEARFNFQFSTNPLRQGEELQIFLTTQEELGRAQVEIYNLAGSKVFQGHLRQLEPPVFSWSTAQVARWAYLVRVEVQFKAGETLDERKLLLIL